MVRMPIKNFALSAALAMALILVAMPLGGAAHAASPSDGWMMHHGGSARFEPNELPNPFVRDFDGDCEWWKYELKGGKYVRTYCLCRYGDAEIDYRDNVRGQWAASNVMGTVQPTSTAPSPSTAGDVGQAMEGLAPSTAGDITQAMEEAPAEAEAAESEAPAEMAEAEAEMPAETTEMPAGDIVDTLVEAGDFAALLAAVGAADLADALRSDGPFTVFAPNDVAFMALPEGALDELLADPSGALVETLLYHVVDGIVLSSDLTDAAELETLQGSLITVSVDGDTVEVDGVPVLFPDIEVANGVIHVIGGVLPVPAE